MSAAPDLCTIMAQATFFTPGAGQECSAWQAAAAGMPFECDGEPFQLIAQAARGELPAQRTLADMATWHALAGNPDGLGLIREGLMFARMAAAHGVHDDELRVISMLALAAKMAPHPESVELAAEAVARFEIMADAQDAAGEDAAQLLVNGAQNEAPETLERAKQYRAAILSAKGE